MQGRSDPRPLHATRAHLIAPLLAALALAACDLWAGGGFDGDAAQTFVLYRYR